MAGAKRAGAPEVSGEPDGRGERSGACAGDARSAFPVDAGPSTGASFPARAKGAGLGRPPQFASPLGGREAVLAIGSACFLATLLVYSASAMPFQRFATLQAVVDVFGTLLQVSALVGLVAAVLAALPRTRGLLRARWVGVAGGVVFLAGNAAFCALVLGGAPTGLWGSAAITGTGVLIGVGCVSQCLAWGRALAVCDLRRATGVVAAAAVGAALLGWAQLMLPEVGAVVLFLTCALACVVLPFALGVVGGVPSAGSAPSPIRTCGDAATDHASDPACASGAAVAGPAPDLPRAADAAVSLGRSARVGTASEPGAPSVAARVRAFLGVALVPAVGLALFAMLMGVRGELFFEDYPQYVAVQLVVAALLLVCVLLPVRRPMMQAIYRGLIPTLAVVVLAVNYLSEALAGGTSAEIMLVMVLYTAAALLTLSTLVGMAHAAEFPTDMISALAVGLYALVTVVTQKVFGAADVDSEGVRAFIVVSSCVYAAGMIVFAIWRGMRSGDAALPAGTVLLGATSAVPGALSVESGRDAGSRDVALDALGPTLDERCDALAARHGLTGREREILGYLALGHSGVYIGDELLISPNTVRTHIHNIYRKLEVNSREDVLLLVRDVR